MKLAISQGPSPGGDVAAALDRIGRDLAAAGAAGARMAVFPEVFLPGYNVADPGAAAQSIADWAGMLAPLARQAGCGVTVGVAERAEGVVYNTALAISAGGQLLSQYRKTQLYGARERRLYAPGDRLATFDLEGHKAALLICYDVEFAPHVRALALQGVDLLLVPTGNMEPNGHVSRLTVPAQAIAHRVTIAYANYCGTEGDLTYCGGSLIVAPDGAVLAQAGPGEALIIADISRAPDPALLQTQLEDLRPL